jgi:hypothetical protein
MRKELVMMFTVLALIFVIALTSRVEADDVYCCYQKEHGQLRVVNDHSECLLSELPVTLGGTFGTQRELVCVTGELYYDEFSESTGYCTDPYVAITNQPSNEYNAEDVFEVFCEAPSGDEDVLWGLRCKEGWMNTGCSGSTFDASGELDLPQFLNGCHSDSEEYGNANIFTTCCKIVVATE